MRSLLPLIFALITVAKASAGVCDFGFAEFDQGANPDVAQKALRECLLTADLEPDAKADHLSMLAVSLQRLGRVPEAAAALEGAIGLRSEPNLYEYFSLAEVYARMKDFPRVHATLDRAEIMVPKLASNRRPHFLEQVGFFRYKFRLIELQK